MGVLDEIELEEPTENSAEEQTNSEEEITLENITGVETTSLEVGGVRIEGNSIEDALGNKWQVPGGNVEDLDDLYAGDVYKLPKEMTDVFHVQLIAKRDLKEYLLRRFVPVTLKELGVPEELLKTGDPLDSYHCVGDAIMVKIPHEINNMLQKRKTDMVKKRLMDLEPTKEMMDKAGVDSGLMVEHKLGFTKANPSNRQGLFANEKGEV